MTKLKNIISILSLAYHNVYKNKYKSQEDNDKKYIKIIYKNNFPLVIIIYKIIQ